MNINPILVVSHPRSGSHFLMTALRQNFPKTFCVQSPYFALDNLLIPSDKSIKKRFVEWYNQTINENKIPLIEIKCLLEDLQNFIEINDKNSEEVRIVNKILSQGIFLNIIRDPRDCLLSWYKLCKSGGAITFAGSKFRLSNMDFEEFICSTNMHKLPNRKILDCDSTTLDFCAYHHSSWKSFTANKQHKIIYYNELNKNYEKSIKEILTFLENKLRLKLLSNNIMIDRPPNAYDARYYRKIGKFIKNFEPFIYSRLSKKFFNLFNINLTKFREKVFSSFLASSLPEVERQFKPKEDLNVKILEKYNKAYEKYSGTQQTKFI